MKTLWIPVALSFRDEIDKMVKDTKMSVHIRIGTI